MTPTAEEILNSAKDKIAITNYGKAFISLTVFMKLAVIDEISLTAMKEIASLSWEAGKQRGILEERHDTEGLIPESVTKESFMKKLF